MSWALSFCSGAAPPCCSPAPLLPSLPGQQPGEAGAERRAEIWQRTEDAGLGQQAVEGVKAGGTTAGSSTWAPARDGGIAATPCPAQRHRIRTRSLLAACTGGLTVPSFTARGAFAGRGLAHRQQEQAPHHCPAPQSWWGPQPEGTAAAQAGDRQGSPWAGGSSPLRDTPCLHKPERGKVRLILNLNKQGEKAMPELALPKGDAQQQGTAPVARLRPAQLPAGLSPGACIAPEEPGQTQIPNPAPGGLPFPQGTPAESVLAAGRAAATRLCKTMLASTGKHPPWDPRPTGNSTGARLSPGHGAQCSLGKQPGGTKKI